MGARPVTAVWGIGSRTAAHLAELGIHTVIDLARADHDVLARRFGPRIGPSLRVLGLGGDDDPVVGDPYVPKSRSKEVTFEHDVRERSEIEGHVARLAGEVTQSVVAEGRRVTHVAVKVRTAAFFTTSRIRKLPGPTTDPSVVTATALGMLDLFDSIERGRPMRLLGVRVMLEPLT
jgi:DNA polymerase-4